MSSYLYPELNDVFHALTTIPKLQIVNPNPRGKIIQNVKFLSVSQNNDLSLKLDSTCQNKSKGMLVFLKVETSCFILCILL